VEDLKKAVADEPVEGYELKYMDTERGGKEPLLVAKEASRHRRYACQCPEQSSASQRVSGAVCLIDAQFKGWRHIRNVTATNVGKRLAIVLDGKVVSAPLSEEAIPSARRRYRAISLLKRPMTFLSY